MQFLDLSAVEDLSDTESVDFQPMYDDDNSSVGENHSEEGSNVPNNDDEEQGTSGYVPYDELEDDEDEEDPYWRYAEGLPMSQLVSEYNLWCIRSREALSAVIEAPASHRGNVGEWLTLQFNLLDTASRYAYILREVFFKRTGRNDVCMLPIITDLTNNNADIIDLTGDSE